MKKLLITTVIACISLFVLTGCSGGGETVEESGIPGSRVMGEIYEIKENTLTLKELEGAMFIQRGARGEGEERPAMRVQDEEGGQPGARGEGQPVLRGERGETVGDADSGDFRRGDIPPNADGNRRIIRRGEDGEISEEDAPRPRYTGNVVTVTIPKNMKITTFTFEDGQQTEKSLELSDLKEGEIITVSYGDDGKVSSVTAIPSAVRPDEN